MPVSPEDVPSPPAQPQESGCLSTIARLIWGMAGNFALVVVIGLIVLRRSFSYLDIVYWAVVGLLLFVRYADIRWLKGLGPDAEPATMKDWARYSRLLAAIAGGVWLVVHVVLLFLRR